MSEEQPSGEEESGKPSLKEKLAIVGVVGVGLLIKIKQKLEQLFRIVVKKQKKKVGRPSVDLVLALVGADPSTRRMAVLFWMSSFCAFCCIFWVAYTYIYLPRYQRNVAEFYRYASFDPLQFGPKKIFTATLGSFSFDLQPSDKNREHPQAEERKSTDFSKAVQVELQVECEIKSTCLYLEGNLTEIRDRIFRSVPQLRREEILTREGKMRLKQHFTEIINRWLPNDQGKVKTVFFAQFLVG